jgi:ribosomal protein S27AE
MQFHLSEKFCPRCRKPLSDAIIEPHPTRTDVALHNYECVDCGPVMTTVVSLLAEKLVQAA